MASLPRGWANRYARFILRRQGVRRKYGEVLVSPVHQRTHGDPRDNANQQAERGVLQKHRSKQQSQGRTSRSPRPQSHYRAFVHDR